MGSVKAKVQKIFYNKAINVIIIGNEKVGKTTALFHMKYNQRIFTIPTMGFNFEVIDHRDMKFNIWDFSFYDKHFGRDFFDSLQFDVIIFVIDSTQTNFNLIRKRFNILLSGEKFKDIPIVIMANMQDKEGAMGSDEIADNLNLYELRDRKWFIKGTCAINGEGLNECLDWISQNVRQEERQEKKDFIYY
jgi:signal recognition particle receptor subunit beta